MQFQQSRIKRILQIAPVSGAIDAVFTEGGEQHHGRTSHGESVAVWGLVETIDGTTEIHGFTIEAPRSGFGLRSAEDDDDFEGYYSVAELNEVCLGRIDDGQ